MAPRKSNARKTSIRKSILKYLPGRKSPAKKSRGRKPVAKKSGPRRDCPAGMTYRKQYLRSTKSGQRKRVAGKCVKSRSPSKGRKSPVKKSRGRKSQNLCPQGQRWRNSYMRKLKSGQRKRVEGKCVYMKGQKGKVFARFEDDPYPVVIDVNDNGYYLPV